MRTNWPTDSIERELAARNPHDEAAFAGSERAPEARQLLSHLLDVDPSAPPASTSVLPSGRRTRVRRRRLGLVSLATGALAVAGAATLVVTVVLPDSPVGRPPSAAAAVLTEALRAAAAQPSLPPLGPGQYYYQQDIADQSCAGGLPSGPVVIYVNASSQEYWVDSNGSGEYRQSPTSGSHFLTPSEQAIAGDKPPSGCVVGESAQRTVPAGSYGAALDLPSDPTTLAALIAAGRVNDVGQIAPSSTVCPSQAGDAPKVYPPGDVCSVSAQFDIVSNLLVPPTASYRLGAVLYQILSLLPGVEDLGQRTDALGRTGTAIEDPASGDVFVLDPVTGALLASGQLATGADDPPGVTPGTVLDWTTYGPISVVDGLGTLPN